MVRLFKAVTFIFCLVLTACSPDSAQYKSETPAFHAETFFNGNLKSWGVFEDFRGQAVERFTMKAKASWDGNKGDMHEYFIFADGRKHERYWTFTKIDDTHFIGTAPDVPGEAKGEAFGSTLHWTYPITLTIQGKPLTVRFDDWLHMVDENHMFSRVKVKKFGLPVGQLTMFFEKE